jgi:outer membrane protein assembly factor BamD (BamD/ComL family)
MRSIEQARSALERGEPERAISYLDAYDRAFPAGAFRQETAVLRVDAYLARGDRPAAARAAAAFVRAHADSPYAVRLRPLAAEAERDASTTSVP